MASQLSLEEQWNSFKVTYNKNYESPEEESRRYEIFKENVQKIEQHNKDYENNKVTYKMGINHFADLRPEEFKKFTGVLKKPSDE